MQHDLFALAERLGQLLKAKNYKITTAESCTGGGIAQCITEIPGSSAWFDRGFVTYSNSAKVQMLGVQPDTLAKYGAVSAETALEMVAGALENSEADCAIAVTGIAGPDGGTLEKPVGTVYIAWQTKNQPAICSKILLTGNRHQIREQTVIAALKGILTAESTSINDVAENYVQLMLDKTKNNRGLALTIFIKLFNELPIQITAISNALKNQQFIQAQDIIHMLHGSASFCGLLAIQTAAKDLEISLINSDIEAAKQYLVELQRHVTALTDHQEAILAIFDNRQ